MLIQINEIKVNEGRRSTDQAKVKELAESIKEVGLINPITVRHDGNLEYELVAGMHRLEACKMLELEKIESNIIFVNSLEAELIEIDENLIRNELHFTERADVLLRRKEIYEELYPETKHGMRNGQTSKKTESDSLPKDEIRQTDKPSFVEDTAKKTGRSETVIKEEIQIAKNLDEEEKEILKEKDVTKTDAIKLARMEPEERKPVINLFIKDKRDQAKQTLNEEYKKISKKIDKSHDNYKLVAQLLNASKFLDINEKHIEDYLSFTDEYFQNNFIKNCDKMINKLNEMKSIYTNIKKIRRVK